MWTAGLLSVVALSVWVMLVLMSYSHNKSSVPMPDLWVQVLHLFGHTKDMAGPSVPPTADASWPSSSARFF